VPRPGNEGAQPLGGEARDASAPRELQQILAVVADKWAFLVIEQLRGRTLRFSELSSAVPCISGRMLTKTLRQLERDGLVSRTLHAVVQARPRLDASKKDRPIVPVCILVL
jgi:DNA-binding HxlR family transcriptional regulator